MNRIYIAVAAFVFSVLSMQAAGTDAGTGTGPGTGTGGGSSESDWSDAARARVVYNNGGFLPVYRIAFGVDYYRFVNVFHSSVDEYNDFCREVTAYLNDLYVPQCGICFELVEDERLIVREPGKYTMPGNSNNGSVVIYQTTAIINDMIGEDAYDTGVYLTALSNASGQAILNGAYKRSQKGGVAAFPAASTIAHELGHFFGSAHTFAEGGSSSYYTEPGNGQSIMSYGEPRDFLSLVSLYNIRYAVHDKLGYYTYPDRAEMIKPDLITDNPYGYDYFPAAIATGNQAPKISYPEPRQVFDIPAGTYFQFNIDASDPDGDALTYMAHQSDISKKRMAKFASTIGAKNPCVTFCPKYEYDAESGVFRRKKYSWDETSGAYRFWLGVTDGRERPADGNWLAEPHAMGYDVREVTVNVVSGTPLKITSALKSVYTAGEEIDVMWNADASVFGDDSRVRILLSADYGNTYPYVLCESALNNGSCRVSLPPVEIGDVAYLDSPHSVHGGVIKVEVIGHVAYATTSEAPLSDNGDGTYSFAGGGFSVVKGTTGVADVVRDADAVTISAVSGAILVEAPECHRIVVADITGGVIYSGAPGTITCAPGFYVVKACGAVRKVCVK